MTIKEQILRLLNKSQSPMTNREIARKIRKPEPSVRRATRALDDAQKLRPYAWDWEARPQRWEIDPSGHTDHGVYGLGA